MGIKKIILYGIIIFAFLLVVYIAGNYYYVVSTERECGFNPINHLPGKINEIWCDVGNYTYYGGFSCMTCERFVEKYNLK